MYYKAYQKEFDFVKSIDLETKASYSLSTMDFTYCSRTSFSPEVSNNQEDTKEFIISDKLEYPD